MRNCPVCNARGRTKVFAMTLRVPDMWPLPKEIEWYTCNYCNMIYGDGNFDQAMLTEYYSKFYGYGLSSPRNVARLKQDAVNLANSGISKDVVILDFGGRGDHGNSTFTDTLHELGFVNAISTNAGDELPESVDVIFASHVIEHIYDLREVMQQFSDILELGGELIIDGPDSTGILLNWEMPILDYNTKHVNHFTLRDYLNLGHNYGFEMVSVSRYEMDVAPAYQVHYKRFSVAHDSANHIKRMINERVEKLKAIDFPVNIWGMSDIVWHVLSLIDLDVLDYIDNDPAYRGQTYKGKPVLELPTNDAPIVILAQGQRKLLIENIRKAGVTNRIIEI